jgi:hypothetical protein
MTDTFPAELRANARTLEAQGLAGLAAGCEIAAVRLEVAARDIARLHGQLDDVCGLLREARVYAPRAPRWARPESKRKKGGWFPSDLGDRIDAKLAELEAGNDNR